MNTGSGPGRSTLLAPARRWLSADMPALPVDIFRICVGALAASYFVRLLAELPEISSPYGLIDHALVQDIYWYTRIGLFQAGTPGWLIALVYGVGLVASVGIIAGHRPRLAALIALVVAASAYRWNFVVMYLDDAVVHLVLFWVMLLPVGRTLTLEGLITGRAALDGWRSVRVPGTAVRCLLVNVCWIYFLAGAWKLDSILWREGFGLYASVKVEVARMPDFWGLQHLTFLRWSDYLVLLVEPILPLPMLLGNRWLRYTGALGFAVFNLFILTTLGIAWAIAGLTCTLVLFLADDVARLLGARAPSSPATSAVDPAPRSRWTKRERAAVAFLCVVCVAAARHIPVFGALNVPAYAALWMVGVAQDYRLFNWIDRVNYHVRTHVEVAGPDGSQLPVPARAYPDRFRAKLLQAYAHDVRWLILPDERRFELRLSIARRHAAWFCRFVSEPGTRVHIWSTIHPIEPDNLDLARHTTMRLAEFTCVPAGSVSVEEGGVPVPAGWPYLQAHFLQGLNRLD